MPASATDDEGVEAYEPPDSAMVFDEQTVTSMTAMTLYFMRRGSVPYRWAALCAWIQIDDVMSAACEE